MPARALSPIKISAMPSDLCLHPSIGVTICRIPKLTGASHEEGHGRPFRRGRSRVCYHAGRIPGNSQAVRQRTCRMDSAQRSAGVFRCCSTGLESGCGRPFRAGDLDQHWTGAPGDLAGVRAGSAQSPDRDRGGGQTGAPGRRADHLETRRAHRHFSRALAGPLHGPGRSGRVHLGQQPQRGGRISLHSRGAGFHLCSVAGHLCTGAGELPRCWCAGFRWEGTIVRLCALAGPA